MYRHPALAPLSRDHHLALQLARGIQRNASVDLRSKLPPTPHALAAHVCSVLAAEIEAHFEIEEMLVIEAVRGRDVELDAICAEVVREHAQLRDLVRQLSLPDLPDAPCEDLLDRLGSALEAHVRTEERSFYERIQVVLSEAELLRLGARTARPNLMAILVDEFNRS